MMAFSFSDRIKEHKHITQLDECTWHIQSDPDSVCHAYWITITPRGILMSGDYYAVYVQPSSCRKKEDIVRWCAGATSLVYFVEKVEYGNRMHTTREFDEEKAIDIFWDLIEDSYSDEITRERFEEIMRQRPIFIRGEEEFSEELIKRLEVMSSTPMEKEDDFWEICCKLEWRFGEYTDMCGYNPTSYTDLIKWQHECVVWWAQNVLGWYKGE